MNVAKIFELTTIVIHKFETPMGSDAYLTDEIIVSDPYRLVPRYVVLLIAKGIEKPAFRGSAKKQEGIPYFTVQV
jgi:hypothetical protein